MKRSFILFCCLLSTTVLQADPLSTGCCSKKKHKNQTIQELHFNGGCGCGGGGGNGSDEIPPDHVPHEIPPRK